MTRKFIEGAPWYGFDKCKRCHMEDDRCDHSPMRPDEELAMAYVESMPRYPFLNSVNRYSMFILFSDALKKCLTPKDFSKFYPKQPSDWRFKD